MEEQTALGWSSLVLARVRPKGGAGEAHITPGTGAE